MAKTLYKLKGPSGASFEIVDNGSGGIDLKFGGTQQSNIASLTDSTAGTADGTVENVSTAVTGVDGTGSNAASKVDVDARLVSINNNFKELTDKVNAILSVLQNTGLMA